MREIDKPIGDPSFDHQRADMEDFLGTARAERDMGRPERMEESLNSIDSNISIIESEIESFNGTLERIENILFELARQSNTQKQILENIKTIAYFTMGATFVIATVAIKYVWGW